MRESRTVWKFLSIFGVGLVAAAASMTASPARLAVSSTPPAFEPAGGGRSGFLSKAGGRTLHLDPSGLVLELDRPQARERRALRMRLVGARATARLAGAGELPGRRNYFLGTPERWRAGVPQYAAVRLEGIYPGVDLLVRTERDHWEYDFVLAPGASPGAIRMRFEGTSRVAIGREGDLLLETPTGPVRHSRPRIYQEIEGRRVPIAGRFASRGPATIGFLVGSYDRRRPLIIDPAILVSAEGSAPGEQALAVAVDATGSTYVAGSTGQGQPDAFVTKLDPNGSPVYTTYLGGSLLDFAVGIAVDPAGNAYVTGQTSSPDFPVTPGALQPAYGDPETEQGDAFVAKLDPSGQLAYASFFGGAGKDEGSGIALDGAGNVYLTGETDSFDDPSTPEIEQAFPLVAPIGPQPEAGYGLVAYVTKLSPAFSILFSTLIPGTEVGWGIAVDDAGDVYVAGETAREDLPAAGGVQPALGSAFQNDAFVVKLRPAEGQLAYATYLGGSHQDGAFGLAVDGAGHVYVTGLTLSPDFPVQNPFQPELANHRFYDAFVAKLAPSGASLVYSTFLGGSVVDTGSGIAADGDGNAFVAGETASGGEFPILRAPQRVYGGGAADAFLLKLDPAGVPIYSTYLGDEDTELGRAVTLDANGEPRVVGYVGEGGWFAHHLDNSYTYNPAFTDSNEDVVVEPEDATTQTRPGTLTFASVTVAGETSLATSGTGPAPPAGFQLGDPPTYYELSTTATFEGTVSICIRYDGVSYTDESQLTLQHHENGSWVDVTTSRDPVARVVCGAVTSLSPFAIFEPGAGQNRPPLADAGPDQILECAAAGTSVSLDGSGSSDPDSDALAFTWRDADGAAVGASAAVSAAVPLGSHIFSLTVDDGRGGSASDEVTVVVRDTLPPVLRLSTVALTVGLPTGSAPGAAVDIAGIAAATDLCDPAPVVSHDAPALLPRGCTVVTFTARDASAATAQAQLAACVVYGFAGFLPPVREDGASLFRSGRTVPVKLRLQGADGTPVPDAVARLQVLKITDAVLGTVEEITPEATGGNTGDLFRFDSAAGQYIYNLDTDGLTSGTYRLRAVLDDGTSHEAQVSVR